MNTDKLIASMVMSIFATAYDEAKIKNPNEGWGRGVLYQHKLALVLAKTTGCYYREAVSRLDGWRNPFIRKFYPERHICYFAATQSKSGRRCGDHCNHDAVVCYEK